MESLFRDKISFVGVAHLTRGGRSCAWALYRSVVDVYESRATPQKRCLRFGSTSVQPKLPEDIHWQVSSFQSVEIAIPHWPKPPGLNPLRLPHAPSVIPLKWGRGGGKWRGAAEGGGKAGER